MRTVSWKKYPGMFRAGKITASKIFIMVLIVGVSFPVLCVGLALVLPAVQQAREAARRTEARNQLKLIGLAMHNYHDVYNTFPPSGVFAVSSSEFTTTPRQTFASVPTKAGIPDTSKIRTASGPAPKPEQFGSFEDFANAVQAAQPPPRPPQPVRSASLATPVLPDAANGHHGWLTSILPFLSETEYLRMFEKIDFDQPWTAAQNATVFRTTVTPYISPASIEDASPRAQDKYADAHYAANSRLLRPNSRCDFRDITGGSTNTLMVGQVTTGIQPWGSPENVRDPAAGMGHTPEQFSGPAIGVVQFLMCDGSVMAVSNDVDPTVLEKLAGPKEKPGPKSVFNF